MSDDGVPSSANSMESTDAAFKQVGGDVTAT